MATRLRFLPTAGRAAALLAVAATLTGQVSYDLRSLIRPGDSAPPPPLVFRASTPSLNDSGQVACEADGGILLLSGGKLLPIAGVGDPTPGGGTVLQAFRPTINAAGQIAFEARLTSPAGYGVFLYSEGTILKVVGVGDPSPDGSPFRFLSDARVNEAGQVAFLGGSQSSFGIYLSSAGTITRLAARVGDPVPGGGTIRGFSVPLSLNAVGLVAFSASLAPAGSGVLLASKTGLTTIARDGAPAPGGGAFAQIGSPSLNDAGQIAFQALLSTGGIGLFLFTDGEMRLVARTGDPVPGGGVFAFLGSPSLNASGQIAFRGGGSAGGAAGGIFLWSEGTVSEVMRDGMPSPEGDLFASSFSPMVNAPAQVAFVARLRDQYGGVYLFSEGTISRLAANGDPVSRDPRFLYAAPVEGINSSGKVLVAASMFPGGNGLFDEASNAIARTGDPAPGGGLFEFFFGSSINDGGQVAFVAGLTNGHGVFVASKGSVSEIIRSGDPVPGGGVFFGSSDWPSTNDAGQVAFRGSASSGGGIFLYSEGGFTLPVRQGDPAPGGGTFAFMGCVVLNGAGQIAFLGAVQSPGRSGIFLWSEGVVTAVAQTGDAAPGGGSFDFSSSLFPPPIPLPAHPSCPSLNGAGEVAFGSDLSARPPAVFLYSGGVLSRIAGPGDPIPGGGTIGFAHSASLNDSGLVAFRADTGYFVFSKGILLSVARTGQPAPGGGFFGGSVGPPRLNAAGQVAFSSLLNTGETAAFLATPMVDQ